MNLVVQSCHLAASALVKNKCRQNGFFSNLIVLHIFALYSSDRDSMEDYDTTDVPTTRPSSVNVNNFNEVRLFLHYDLFIFGYKYECHVMAYFELVG